MICKDCRIYSQITPRKLIGQSRRIFADVVYNSAKTCDPGYVIIHPFLHHALSLLATAMWKDTEVCQDLIKSLLRIHNPTD